MNTFGLENFLISSSRLSKSASNSLLLQVTLLVSLLTGNLSRKRDIESIYRWVKFIKFYLPIKLMEQSCMFLIEIIDHVYPGLIR